MTSKAVLILAVLVAMLIATGCRSDGGIDRLDGKHGMAFSTHCLVQQTRVDYVTTRDRIASLPESFARSSAQSLKTIENTYHLYFENHEGH